ncbi:hypothetical protein [Cupriavidus pinatubonensis]|uniref:hypothetical protein n=1 Tax=Cupriavidus pinatubonensis TaxID=248026 RepID=UPI00360F243A
MAYAEARARLEAQATTLTDRRVATEQAQGRQALELERVDIELASAQRPAERAEAEAGLARSDWRNCGWRCTSGTAVVGAKQ